ncbi:MAG TPA: hypothetical protein VGI10_04425 [Polyangiaceae bacterium]
MGLVSSGGLRDVMKLYKSIFRVDFPLCFGIIDRLGKYSDFLHKTTQRLPFVDAKSEVNLVNNTLANSGRVDNDHYRFGLTITSLDAVTEHTDGVEVGELAKHPVFEVGDAMRDELKGDIGTVYERVGLRVWILVEEPSFSFEGIRDALRANLPQLDGPVSKAFPKPKDLAIVFEATNEHDVDARVACGPYRSSEYEKYFKKEPALREGLVLDIDFSERKVDIPGFRFSRFAARSEAQMLSVVGGITTSLRARDS